MKCVSIIFILNIYVSDSTLSVDFKRAVSKQKQVDSSSIYPSWPVVTTVNWAIVIKIIIQKILYVDKTIENVFLKLNLICTILQVVELADASFVFWIFLALSPCSISTHWSEECLQHDQQCHQWYQLQPYHKIKKQQTQWISKLQA